MYAYRGYDGQVVRGRDQIARQRVRLVHLNDRELPLLQTYRFVQQGSDGKYSNNDWAKVCYNSNYTIDAMQWLSFLYCC